MRITAPAPATYRDLLPVFHRRRAERVVSAPSWMPEPPNHHRWEITHTPPCLALVRRGHRVDHHPVGRVLGGESPNRGDIILAARVLLRRHAAGAEYLDLVEQVNAERSES